MSFNLTYYNQIKWIYTYLNYIAVLVITLHNISQPRSPVYIVKGHFAVHISRHASAKQSLRTAWRWLMRIYMLYIYMYRWNLAGYSRANIHTRRLYSKSNNLAEVRSRDQQHKSHTTDRRRNAARHNLVARPLYMLSSRVRTAHSSLTKAHAAFAGTIHTHAQTSKHVPTCHQFNISTLDMRNTARSATSWTSAERESARRSSDRSPASKVEAIY